MSAKPPKIDPRNLRIPGGRPAANDGREVPPNPSHSNQPPADRDDGDEANGAIIPTPKPTPIGGSKAQETIPTKTNAPAPDADTRRHQEDQNPFRKFSLLGHASDLALNAAEARFLLGVFIVEGQLSVVYAAPNTGKTLVMISLCLLAITMGLINPAQLYYINADDSSHGLVAKANLFEAVGAHMLVPGEQGFRTGDLAKLLIEAAEGGFARGMVIVIDTLKKFTDLMDKKASSRFAQVCREFVSKGGTIVCLGHTTKNPNADGTPRYQGTTDILEDCDAAYYAKLLTSKSTPDAKVVQFTKLKSRAPSPESAAYGYRVTEGLSYEGMVQSVTLMDPEELEGHTPATDADDQAIIDDICGYIASGHGGVGQDKLVRAVARMTGSSRMTVRRVLDQQTGSDPEKHCWTFEKGERGKLTYYLLKSGGESDEESADS